MTSSNESSNESSDKSSYEGRDEGNDDTDDSGERGERENRFVVTRPCPIGLGQTTLTHP
ncbi:hypothetical protein ACFQ61_24990 [Streptomyces sp. NPDC056500]|uniref:hypothetical protein n=1 Tax=Streptomyces sp. NPDC056500 TaxID=3345840 RepID=UPI003695E5D5